MLNAIYVVWNDAVSYDSWTSLEDISAELAEIHTLGFIVSETPEVLSVALNFDVDNESVSCMINIPKQWIVSRKSITLAKDMT
ncbi:hypothetical protein EKK58_08410 [Candidatus Dependentiae bacterium]|nr:MAG: hypothetical protein EKK58_08410 [Candidatus Dependentiae bacterium]